MSIEMVRKPLNTVSSAADMQQPDLQIQTPRIILREFSLSTSTHGIPGIARSQSSFNRIYWTISFLAFTGIMIFFLTETIRSYFEYPIQSIVAIEESSDSTFPAVSICNYCPLRYDRLIGPFLNYTNRLHLTNTNDTTTFSIEQSGYIRDFYQYTLNNNQSLGEYFFSLDSMLLSCKYNRRNCSSGDFVSFISPQYGFCYTINKRIDRIRNGSLYGAYDDGDIGILELELYVHSHLYVPHFTDASGVVLAIHDNEMMPHMSTTGYFLMPERKHRLAVTARRQERLGPSYQTCEDKISLGLQLNYERLASGHYSYDQQSCYTYCSQAYVYKYCGCVDPREWLFRSIVIEQTNMTVIAPLCNITDPCYKISSERLSRDLSLFAHHCSACSIPCVSIDFIPKISSLKAPLSSALNTIKTKVEGLAMPLPNNWSTNWQTEIQNNYLMVEVVLESSNTETYTQTPSMTGVDVLSNVGGQTGLWIGISFLSLMEIVEVLFRLARYQWHVTWQKFQQKMRQ